MFDHLEGRLLEVETTRIVLRVGGPEGAVAYQLRVPVGTGQRLRSDGGHARVFAQTCVQDELPRLFGFASREERDLFRLLIKVQSVGPSLALSLLSADSPHRILAAIRDEELDYLKRIKGIGAKTAQRLCLEIKDRAGTWLDSLAADQDLIPRPGVDSGVEDAVLALGSLGFSSPEARTRVEKVRQAQPDADTQTLVKAALRS